MRYLLFKVDLHWLLCPALMLQADGKGRVTLIVLLVTLNSTPDGTVVCWKCLAADIVHWCGV